MDIYTINAAEVINNLSADSVINILDLRNFKKATIQINRDLQVKVITKIDTSTFMGRLYQFYCNLMVAIGLHITCNLLHLLTDFYERKSTGDLNSNGKQNIVRLANSKALRDNLTVGKIRNLLIRDKLIPSPSIA